MVCHRQKTAARSPQTGAWVFVCHSLCQLVFPELMLDTPYLLCIPTCSAGAVPPDAQTADFHICNLHFKLAHRSKTIRPPFPIEKIPKNWNRSFQVKSLQAHGSGRRAPLPPQLFSLFPCKPLAFSCLCSVLPASRLSAVQGAFSPFAPPKFFGSTPHDQMLFSEKNK